MRLALAIALFCASAAAIAEPIGFEGDTVGQPPASWTCGATGRGAPKWTVEADPSVPGGKALRQSGSATFPWCVKGNATLTDGWVEAKFKPLSGREDQAGGVVWRWKDGDNYYVSRANALEDNVSLYYTRHGRRITSSTWTHQWRTTNGTPCAWSSQANEFASHSMARSTSRPTTIT